MRLYRLLLHLYPTSFRADYGEELIRVFKERRQQISNPLEVFALWFSEVIDVVADSIRAHWDILRQDLRYSARTLVRAPEFALTAIMITGLGIGATTAVF